MPITVNNIAPMDCPLAGARVTINGAHFAAGTTVTFGGAAGTGVNIVSAAQLTVVAPARDVAGPVQVRLRKLDGSTTLFVGFNYRADVTAITPAEGPTGGATDVVITGKGFHDNMEVDFGGTAGTHVDVRSATEIRARTPAHAAGLVAVDVWNAGRPTGARRAQGFAYCAPLVTGALPAKVAPAGGDDVVIRGKYFEPAATVSFGGTPSPLVNFRSSTEIVARTPAHVVGTVDVEVNNAGPTTGRLVQGLTYIGAEVKSIEPPRGTAAGGTPVTIRGERFAVGATVTIGGNPAGAVVVTPPDRITATTAAHGAGPVDVVVQNGGEAASTLAGAFTFVALPGVTGVDPPQGGTAGGTAVRITGTSFVAGATVTIGGNPATNVAVVSATTLTATTAAHAAGQVDVVVQNGGGAPTTLAGAYTYTNVVSIDPPRGLPAGGTDVVIRGHGFAVGATVTIGGNPATNVDRRSATEIRARTAAHAAGQTDVVVTNPSQPAMTLTNGFTFAGVTSVAPKEGSVGGGTVVVIRGDGFTGATTVAFGGAPAAAVAFQTAQEIHATTAATPAGPVNVVVTTAGVVETVNAGFTFRGAPAVTGVDPAAGPVAGGTNVTITGTGFVDGATVDIGGTAAINVQVLSPTTLKATTAAHVAGACDVTVTILGAVASPALVGGFTYRPLPTVINVVPANGPVAGGRAITVTGTDFLAGIKVTVDGQECTDVTVVSAVSLRARVPAHAAGPCPVRVQNPGEPLSVALPNAFTYVDLPTETGDNQVVFVMDGEEYFTLLRNGFEAVRRAPRHDLTYVRLAFWMIDKSVTLGDRNCFRIPNHRLLCYIDQVIRAGHDVDIIVWRPAQVERVSEGKGVAETNEPFGEAVAEIDLAAAAAGPGVGRVRVFLETYEGEIGASNHEKIAIFSLAGQRTAVIGGLNLSPAYFAPDNHQGGYKWHDAAVMLRGPATDDVEAEWMRRWRRTAEIEERWVWNSFGGGGDIKARGFAFTASQTVRREAIKIRENTTLQNPHPDNRTVTIALTRSVGSTRIRKLRDLLLQRIGAANNYIYMENYHFADPEIVQAIYTRHEQRRLAGHDLRVVIMMPLQGGGSGYMTRRSWLQMALRFRAAVGGAHLVQRVYYMHNGGEVHIDRNNCLTWTVADTYDPGNPTATSWLQADTLTFRRNGGGGIDTVVKLEDITRVVVPFHIYTSLHCSAGGARVYNHSKVAIIDDQWLIVGSANWSYRSMQYDGEISAFVDSAPLAQAALARLLGHYDTVTAIDVNNIEAEACTNLAGVLGTNLVRQAAIANHYIILPVCHFDMPNLAFPRVRPGITETPNYTWI